MNPSQLSQVLRNRNLDGVSSHPGVQADEKQSQKAGKRPHDIV